MGLVNKISNLFIKTTLILLVSIVSLPMVANAQVGSTSDIIQRGEYWYSPDASSATGCYNEGEGLSGANNAESIWGFLADPAKNLKDFQIAGIMGNMQHESGLNPNAAQPSTTKTAEEYVELGWHIGSIGHAYGLVQWDPGSKLIDNTDPLSKANSLDYQLNFLWTQLLGKGPVAENPRILDQIRSTTSIEDAVLAFQGNTAVGGSYIGFERPADQRRSVPDRVAAAKLFLDRFKGTTTTYNPVNDTCTSSFVGGDFISTLTAYAHPEYHPKPYTKLMPAYKDAVEKAIADGRFVGGNKYKGVDCGGFVTLLVNNSGFDKSYNYSGKGGNVPIQEKWLKENWQQIFPTTTADHQPGDVAINDNHTYIYVGEVTGFDSDTASASLDGRAPMAGSEIPADPDFRWYRKD